MSSRKSDEMREAIVSAKDSFKNDSKSRDSLIKALDR